MPPNNAKEILATCQIPSIPKNLKDILDAASDPNMSNVRLEKIVLKDASLTTQLLKIVNSAFYAMSSKVMSIQQAIVLLGFPSVKSIASGLLMTETFSRMGQLNQEYLTAVWRNSLVVSSMIPMISPKMALKERDDLVLAALLHHVGHLVLCQKFGEDYLDHTRVSLFPAPSLESKKYGVNHAEIGSELLKEWGLPPGIVNLVHFHHHPEQSPENAKKIRLMQVCDELGTEAMALPFIFDTDESGLMPELRDALKAAELSWTQVKSKKELILGAIKTISESF